MPNALTDKLGPLPTWGWIVIATGILVGYTLVRGKKSSSSTATSATAQQQELAAEEAAAANAAQATAVQTPNYNYGMQRGKGVYSWNPAQSSTGTVGTTTTTGTGTTTGTTGTGTTTAPTPTPAPASQVGTYKAPTGVTSKVNGTTVTITWSLAGQSSPPPGSYTVAIYNSSGVLKGQSTVSVPDTTGGQGTYTTSGLPKGTYHANVWANGGKTAPPHATTNFTIG